MKSLKMLGLAALAALMAMAFVGASSASAESTALCATDVATCGSPITHIHEATLSGLLARLLASPEVQCSVLFLGDTIFGLGSPLRIEGNFTYSNCGNGCTVEEEKGAGAVSEVLKEGHETARVTGEFEIHASCFGLNCYYNGFLLLGTAKGPLLSFESNGEVSLTEQTLAKVKGVFCPSFSKLDIRTTPLSATYITG